MLGTELNSIEISEMKQLSEMIWKGRCAKSTQLTKEETKTPVYLRYCDLLVRYFNHNQNK